METESASLRVFSYIFANILLQYNQLGTYTFTDPLLTKYDFVIIGGGTAGCVVASRLSEISNFTVLLIESGGSASNYTDIALFASKDYDGTPILPSYYSVPQEVICQKDNGKKCKMVYGNVLGGGSIVNPGNYIRSTRIDYDGWEAAGAIGWSYADVLPYFKKMETYRPTVLDPPIDLEARARKGPLQITNQHNYGDLIRTFLTAANDNGFLIKDPNDGVPATSAFEFQSNMRNGVKSNSKRSYLEPVLDRPNLHVVCFARVTKINFDPLTQQAISVEYQRRGITQKIDVGKEVILTAGAIQTPKLLMQSGVGDPSDLIKHNIPVIHPLPGVGNGLSDHVRLNLFYDLDRLYMRPLEEEDISAYNKFRKSGMMAKNYKLAMLFFSSTMNFTHLDTNIEIGFSENRKGRYYPVSELEYERGKTRLEVLVKWHAPRSEGTVKLASSDPHDDPVIDGRWLMHPSDLKSYVRGVRKALEYFESPILNSIGLTFVPFDAPACSELLQSYGLKSDQYLECVIRQLAQSDTHFCRTCRMGDPSDPKTVVDPQLKVKGLPNVRIMDASVFPVITKGNTMTPTIMVAEKGSDIVKTAYDVNNISPQLPLLYHTII